MQKLQRTKSRQYAVVSATAVLFGASVALGQAASSSALAQSETEDTIVLSPFEVTTDSNNGYTAATTLAGNRLNTELRDIGNAVTVITPQFLQDIGATNSQTLLQYTAGTEVGNVLGNFAGLGDGSFLDEGSRFSRPNQNTRVRGLAEADNTRDYFLSDIPWDSYNVDRVDLQRGPNSILFGLGSPAGLLNVGTKQAAFKDSNEVQLRLDNWGTVRLQGNFNKVLLPGELAVRLDTVHEKKQFQQDPAFEDNKRVYGALRWEPKFLKKGDARTIIKANAEYGNIDSNQPRSVPPLDRITPWFYTGTYEGTFRGQDRTFNNLNRETFNPFQLQDDNTGRANHGQQRPVINGGPLAGSPNPAYNPWIGNFGDQFGGTNAFYTSAGSTTPTNSFVWEGTNPRAIGPDGNIDGGLARSFHRPGGITRYDQFAVNAGLPYSAFGLYKAKSLTDPTVFDFYNNLLDGPNKNEWNDWHAYDVSLAQTFMNDKFGFDLTYHNEKFTRGQVSLLSGDRQAIYVDINNVYSDGTPEGLNGEPFQDGTPNPNVGRAFISDSGRGGNNEYISERDALRLTAFFTHDFRSNGDSWWRRIVGKHTFTGLYNEDNQNVDCRNWNRYAIDDAGFREFRGINTRFSSNEFAVNRVIYLGDALTSATGANLPRPMAVASVPSQLTVRAWDSTWAGGDIDPAAPWENAYYPEGHASRPDTQSNNPSNYVGFRDINVNVIDAEASKENRDRLTTGAQLTETEVTSKAFVWQGYLLDRAVVGTWGWRQDIAKFRGMQLAENDIPNVGDGRLDLSPTNYRIPDVAPNRLDVQSRAYSIMVHLNELPYIAQFAKDLPIQVSAYYNQSSNFQPASSRVDVYGEPLAPPSGKTIDRGILLESRDGKYSLKVNKFITSLKDASSNALGGSWFIGASQAWAGNWANRFEYDYAVSGPMVIGNQANNRPAGAANPPGYSPTNRPGNPDFDPGNTMYNYGTDLNESPEQAAAREAAAVSAWRAWQSKVDPRFYAAWGINLNDYTQEVNASQPLGFTVTEDSVSEGYEIEFNANPTRNWRLTFNATKVEARRSNVGGTNLREFITAYEDALNNTAAGDLRIWWGGAGNETTLYQWRTNVGSEWAQKALAEGTNVPELRKWRFNAITTYNFEEGSLKGLFVGGGVRWQDKVAIGYPPTGFKDGSTTGYENSITFDLNDPYYGPTETNFDAWIGYTRKLSRQFFSRNIEWTIQLNASNIGQGNELIPVTVQPDGTPATFRIAPHQYFTLTNTFRF